MNGIWIPVTVTLLMVILVVCDIWDNDEWEQFKKEWFLASIALSIKPGLMIAAAWIVWWEFFYHA